MKPGDMLEIAIWLSGTETPEQIAQWKDIDSLAAVAHAEREFGVNIGPLEFSIKVPGEDRVPPVPDHIAGPDVKLLVGEAKVAYRPGYTIVPATGFVSDLEKDDREKLRGITRRAHAKRHPGDRLTDRHCDQIIEALGPDVAVKTLREGAASH